MRIQIPSSSYSSFCGLHANLTTISIYSSASCCSGLKEFNDPAELCLNNLQQQFCWEKPCTAIFLQLLLIRCCLSSPANYSSGSRPVGAGTSRETTGWIISNFWEGRQIFEITQTKQRLQFGKKKEGLPGSEGWEQVFWDSEESVSSWT